MYPHAILRHGLCLCTTMCIFLGTWATLMAQGPVPVASGLLPSTGGGFPATEASLGPGNGNPNPVASNPATSNPATSNPTIPSIESPAAQAANRSSLNVPKALGRIDLPTSNGQQWVEYDIRPYTQNQKNVERPQQAIIDWVLRETGTDVWFNEPMGILHADRNTLRVYHNAAMQRTVGQIYERFVNGVTEPQVYGLRLITVGNPNWRNKATPLMRSAAAQTPGVQAWLMSKENKAIFTAQLRDRIDVRELQAVDIPLVNGQMQPLEQLRSRNFLREYKQNTTAAWPPYTPVTDEIKEGFKLQLSPLMSLDGRALDLMLKCDIDQVERLNSVTIDLPNAFGPSQSVQIDVPQVVSWRLHERFRWPSDQILLLSCGIVAAPAPQVNNTLLGGSPPSLFGLNKILPTQTGSRTDALLLIEHKGAASTQLNQPANAPSGQSAASSAATPLSRGRY
jgi:hypothetical protein